MEIKSFFQEKPKKRQTYEEAVKAFFDKFLPDHKPIIKKSKKEDYQ